MKPSEAIVRQIETSLAADFRNINPFPSRKLAEDLVDLDRTREQYALLERYCGSIRGKHILEVGSGYGLFTGFGNKFLDCRVEGIEPAEDEFGAAYDISLRILAEWGLDPGLIHRGSGEAIPFPDNTFDVVYSSNVLEHVQDPLQVIAESIRVLKPGGHLQFVVPNYGSFWEGHYCVLWPPYLAPFLAKLYARILGRDPGFVDRLQFVNYFMLKRILKPFVQSGRVKVLTWGEEVFSERMTRMNFSSWAGLGIVKSWVQAAHRLHLIHIITRGMNASKAFTPIILTLRKES